MTGIVTSNSSFAQRIDQALFRISRIIPGHLPNFLIVGAQKSGTTGLFNLLKQHPELHGSARKEIHFFNNDTVYAKGLGWYKRHFWNYSRYFKRYPLYFEATPDYLYCDQSLARITAACKEIKVIILLRDPVKRAYSAWNMFRDWREQGKVPAVFYQDYIAGQTHNLRTELFSDNAFPSFEACLESELDKISEDSPFLEPSLLRRGIYLPQLKRYHEVLGKERVLLLTFGELKRNQTAVLNKVLRFLDLPESDWSFLKPDTFRNARPYTESMNPATRERLEAFFAPHNEALFEYLGHDLDWQ